VFAVSSADLEDIMRSKKSRPVYASLAVILLGAPLLHHAAYKIASFLGVFARLTLRHRNPADGRFTTDQLCWASGFMLEAGKCYRITLETGGDWFDHVMRADIVGVASRSGRHLMATPLKRWWFENWFQPIARIGETGNDEYVLRPNTAPARHEYGEAPTTTPLSELRKTDHFTQITPEQAELLMRAYRVPEDRRTLVSDITARTSGQLYLYVNDAVLMWPKRMGMFYPNNYGHATVKVALSHEDGSFAPLTRYE
jgi:hypothetical protein